MSDAALFFAIAVAGGIGAALRYLANDAVPAVWRERYPWGTTVVNVSGSLALGLVAGFADSTLQTVVGVGLLGGYTTFSAASLETVELLIERRWSAAALNGVGMFAVCTAAALVGLAISQR